MELGGSTFWTSEFTTKLYSQTVWYWHKNRNIDQWNKIKKARNKLMHLWAPYLDKAVKNMKWWKDSLFINNAGKIGQLHVKE